jgi:predicted nucleic acid-binding protein
MSGILGKDVEMKIRLVVDTSSMLPELMSYVRVGKSTLDEVTKTPFVELYAPPKLIQEVGEKIPMLSKKHRLDHSRLAQAWEQIFLPRIRVLDASSPQALLFAKDTVGKRDPEDMPFVALSFSLRTHGIVTQDKDLLEQPDIRTWKMGNVRKFVTVFKRGVFSFFVSANFIVPLLKAVLQIAISILRALLEFAWKLVTTVIVGLSKLPDWAKALLGLATIAVLAVKEAREKAIQVAKEIYESIANFLTQMYNLLRQLLEKIGPYVEIAINALLVLFNSIDESIMQLRSIQITV